MAVGAVAERLYYDSAELAFRATVRDIRLVANEAGEAGDRKQLWQVALDRTAFYPESGGQPWDTGVLVATARSGAVLEVPVERVEEDDAGEVWHFVRKPLVEGTEIDGRVNAARRLDHVQQHSGQHLLSAVFLSEVGARTVSFHLGALHEGLGSSTIDLALAEGALGLSAEDVARVELRANELIAENRAMAPRWHSREEAEAMLARGELRKLPERSGPMRIVEMRGVEFNACGGTHVGATGAIGGLLVRKVEKARGGWRVEFVCGLRAVAAARRDFEVLGKTAGLLSVGAANVPGRVGVLLEEMKAGAKAQRAVLDELAKLEAERLVAAGEDGAEVQAVFAGRDVEFAKRVASHAASLGRAAVVGATNGETGALVLAQAAGSEVHAGNLLREVLSAAGARGGGSAEMAQGVCRAEQTTELMAILTGRLSASA